MRRLAPHVALLAPLALLPAFGCGADAPPRLQVRLTPASLPATVPTTGVSLPPAIELVAAPDGGAWLRAPLPPDAWRPSALAGVWHQRRPVVGEGSPATGPAQHLVARGQALTGGGSGDPYRHVDMDTSRPDLLTVEPGVFCAIGDQVFLALSEGAEPPDAPLELYEYLTRGGADGVAWRVAVGEVEAEGLPLLSGESCTLVLEPPLPAGHVLSFWTTARPLAGTPTGEERVELTVLLDGEPLAALPGDLQPRRTTTHAHRLPLPAHPGGARLEFRLAGDPAVAALHRPRVHAADVGTPGHRPAGIQRPDLALVVADTFRADNLVAYGGPPGIAPELDRLADRGRVYTRAWATSPWTLPSHASLFTGLVPPAVRCTSSFDRLSESATTLAERLRDAGYRTVAVTDRGFVSRDHGLAQGFEWFQEVVRRGEGSLDEALADVLAQLEADDGRPLFLFFQTYRAHTPYEVSPETVAELADRYPLGTDYETLSARHDLDTIAPGEPAFDGLREAMEGLYRGASRDTSRGLGRLARELEERGLLDTGHLVLTSDHGEAFGEHGLLGHGSTVHEPQVRVPLLHVGAGVEPARIDTPCSLLDVPTTLVALAGLLPGETWMGFDLRELPDRRVLFAFVGTQRTAGDRGGFAARELDRKLYFPQGDPNARPEAFDLARDPLERADRFGGADWPQALWERVRSGYGALVSPRLEASRASLSGEARRQLDALGYGETDEDG